MVRPDEACVEPRALAAPQRHVLVEQYVVLVLGVERAVDGIANGRDDPDLALGGLPAGTPRGASRPCASAVPTSARLLVIVVDPEADDAGGDLLVGRDDREQRGLLEGEVGHPLEQTRTVRGASRGKARDRDSSWLCPAGPPAWGPTTSRWTRHRRGPCRRRHRPRAGTRRGARCRHRTWRRAVRARPLPTSS